MILTKRDQRWWTSTDAAIEREMFRMKQRELCRWQQEINRERFWAALYRWSPYLALGFWTAGCLGLGYWLAGPRR